MNAIECIKWFGLDHAKYLIKEKINGHDHEFTLEDLKRLVESLDLVKEYGGIINSKMDIRYLDIDWDYDTPRRKRLEQAIADYESIYGGEHV